MFCVTINAPGYAPDSEGYETDTWALAKLALREELCVTWDGLMPDATDHTPLNDACAEANSLPEDYVRDVTIMLVGLAHNITRS